MNLCVLFSLGVWVGDFFAIICFKQWGESEERESAACWFLSHKERVLDSFIEDDVPTSL